MPSLLAILGLDGSGFHQGLAQAQNRARATGHEIGSSLSEPIKAAIGAFAVGALIEATAETAERAAALSREFRVSAETVQRWDIAAKRAGLSAEDLGNALNRLKRARERAVGAGDPGGFSQFQIPMQALRDATISTEQILERMVQVTGGAEITDAQDVAGMEMMGKSGAKILSAFTELHDLGPVTLLSNEEVQNLHEANEAYGELVRHAKSFVAGAYTGVVKAPPAILQAVKDLWHEAFGKKTGEVFGFDVGDALHPAGSAPDKFAQPLGPEQLSKKEQADYDRLQAEIAEKVFQNKLRTLGVEERRAALNAEIAKHEKAAADAAASGDWKTRFKEQLEAEKLRGENELRHHARRHADVNALQRIGAFSRGESSMEGTMKEIKVLVSKISGKESRHHRHGPGGFG